MKLVAFAALTAVVLSAGTALAESEQPHPGFKSQTYHGGWVGPTTNEAPGGFDLSRASPLYGGGQAQEVHAKEGRVVFDFATATRVGPVADGATMIASGGTDAAN